MEQTWTTNYEEENGKVVVVKELRVRDLGSKSFVVAEQTKQRTGKTREELRAENIALRDMFAAHFQAEIDKLDALAPKETERL